MKQQIFNRTIFTGDNLPILRGMNTESVDLVYLDPPFNSNRNYQAPIGSEAAGAAFKDAWTLDDVDVAWWELIKTHHPALEKLITAAGDLGGRGDKSYLIYMAIRLLELRRILKNTGSIYLHCDQTMSHSLKMVMDAVFGKLNFKNEIIWCYGLGGSSKRQFSKKHDNIYFYTKTDSYFFSKPVEPSSSAMMRGKPKGMIDVWNIPTINNMAKERTGYPTQKPLALLDPIIQAASNEGDIVLDPFCGCATTCIAAEKHKRQWTGIDISEKSVELVKKRLLKELAIGEKKEQIVFDDKIIHRTDIPTRSETGLRPSDNIKKILYVQQEGFCNGCQMHFLLRNLMLDHIVPKAHGGQDTDDNLQLLCGACNSTKSTDTMADLMTRLQTQSVR